MSLPKSIALYDDVKLVLDQARAAGGGKYTPPGSATRWQQRAYMLRRLLQEQAAAHLPTGVTARTEYDNMKLAISPDRKAVLIRFHKVNEIAGAFEPFEEGAAPVEPAPVADPLFADALELKKELGIE